MPIITIHTILIVVSAVINIKATCSAVICIYTSSIIIMVRSIITWIRTIIRCLNKAPNPFRMIGPVRSVT